MKIIETKLSLPWVMKGNKVIEVFNFKNETSQKDFHKATHDTDELTKIFETNKPLGIQTKKFIKRVDGFINASFKKVKIETSVDHKLEELYDRRRGRNPEFPCYEYPSKLNPPIALLGRLISYNLLRLS